MKTDTSYNQQLSPHIYLLLMLTDKAVTPIQNYLNQ